MIHTKAPNYHERIRSNVVLLRHQLADCYRRCLEEAYEAGPKTIAFPCIGAGHVLGWPRNEAARIGVDTARRWFGHPIRGVERRERIIGPIYFVVDATSVTTEEAWIKAFKYVPSFLGFR